MVSPSPNFAFLGVYDPTLVVLATQAEAYFSEDPATSLIKIRQFGERLAKQSCARVGILIPADSNQVERLRLLRDEAHLDRRVLDLFHLIRTQGNEAVHEVQGSNRDALGLLKVARELAVWFHRTFGRKPDFHPGPFVPPKAPEDPTRALMAELESARAALQDAEATTEAERNLRLSAESRAAKEAEDRAFMETYALEQEGRAGLAESRLKELAANPPGKADLSNLLKASAEAASKITLDEAETRRLIDQQLRAAGWDADTQVLRHSEGTRPQKGRNLAIAEWPTATGPVDYALFCGLQAVGVVEAKAESKHVPTVLNQTERYAEGIEVDPEAMLDGSPWGTFKVPFAFATNSRPYYKQIEMLSGIWFRDLRKNTNLRRALSGWFTPQGLIETLKMDVAQATADLKTDGFDYGFTLREYQIRAISSVETALSNHARDLLLAMATGTGKTKTAIALIYRLLKAKRFRRVLFLVDREALGKQAGDDFRETRMESLQTFADIFELKDLKDRDVDPETRVHIATVQAMVERVLRCEEASEVLPVDQYDLILVDECHRGYTLDQEVGEQDQRIRGFEDYISKYRRVLDHFDAVKIGLTATPALHTVEIFGKPVFTYGYREAVLDGVLADYLPPWKITTKLSKDGLIIAQGQPYDLLRTKTGEVVSATAPDQISFEVGDFNRSILAEGFNRAVCQELAKHIDPSLPGKTLVFCVNDLHADLVTQLLKESLQTQYGELEDADVQKITSKTPDPMKAIRNFKNERSPSIAVTVDLLTTGIDVPEICNLVFLRRVNSRILFDQMMGRATRQCPGIGKTAFQVFDAVGQFEHLDGLTDMRPVVVNPSFTCARIGEELARASDPEDRAYLRDQLLAKARRRIQGLNASERTAFEDATGQSPGAWAKELQSQPLEGVQAWVQAQAPVLAWLDLAKSASDPYLILDKTEDRVLETVHAFHAVEKPSDYLDGFQAFIQSNMNEIPALLAVAQRPRSLTRKDLKALKQALDAKGYSETSLRTAWSDLTNEDIAAGILGHIRRAAIGDHLIPYETRVQGALDQLLKSQPWTGPQRDWLKRIGQQLLQETVVDKEALDQGAFQNAGGFERINKIFGGRLEEILGDLQDGIWKPAS